MNAKAKQYNMIERFTGVLLDAAEAHHVAEALELLTQALPDLATALVAGPAICWRADFAKSKIMGSGASILG